MKVQSFLIKSKCFGCGVNGTNTKLNHYKCVGYYKKKIMVKYALLISMRL